HDGGSLEWAEAEDEERELRERVHRLAGRGYPAEWISRERAAAMEPGLAIADHVQEVAFYAADAWLDAPRLIGRLLAAAAARSRCVAWCTRPPFISGPTPAAAFCSVPRTSTRWSRERIRPGI